MPHSPVGTYTLRPPDPKDVSDTLPKRRKQAYLRCATTQMQEDLQQSAAKVENVARTGSQRKKIHFLP